MNAETVVLLILMGIALGAVLIWLFWPTRRSPFAAQAPPPEEDIQPVLITSSYVGGMQPYYVPVQRHSDPVIIVEEAHTYYGGSYGASLGVPAEQIVVDEQPAPPVFEGFGGGDSGGGGASSDFGCSVQADVSATPDVPSCDPGSF